MFGDMWRRFDMNGQPWHVIKGFDIPYGWDLWRGADDGFAAPAACYWFTQNPDTKTIYVIDELYREGMLPEAFAEEVLKRDRQIVIRMPDGSLQEHGHVLSGLLDSSSFGNTGQALISRGDAMNKLGCRWIPVEKGPNSRAERAQHLSRLLAPNPRKKSEPGIQFFERCTTAIKTIPTLPRSKLKPEEVDKNAPDDHAFDGVTYGLKWKRHVSKAVPLVGI
jgi:hypothetical protein